MNDEPDILAPLRDQPRTPGPPKPHPRDAEMQEAGEELYAMTHEWAVKHRLTTTEYLYLLAVLQRGQLQAACLAQREMR